MFGPVRSVLGVEVSSGVFEVWREWFAPYHQPFRAADVVPGRRLEPGAEVRDTFHMYGGSWIWLEEAEFRQLPLKARRALLRGREATGRLSQLTGSVRNLVECHRTDSHIVWWPSIMRQVGDAPLVSYVEDGVRPSRHREVDSTVWSAVHRLLPGAADLAGTFASGSGPNCFGTVMAAAGVPGAESEWMLQEPFEQWLTAHATPTRGTDRDHFPGIVLVWRDAEGLAAHVAVTIGAGYSLSKPSQAWCSPRLVWTVRETIDATRCHGLTLSRYVLGGT